MTFQNLDKQNFSYYVPYYTGSSIYPCIYRSVLVDAT